MSDTTESRNLVWRFVALPSGMQGDYQWHWRCEHEQGNVVLQSARGYLHYYECLEEARRYGYSGLDDVTGTSAPPHGFAGSPSDTRPDKG